MKMMLKLVPHKMYDLSGLEVIIFDGNNEGIARTPMNKLEP